MQTVVIVIHLLVVVAMVGMILMQRSEGGGLGIGGGGGGGFMSARGAANALTRATSILAVAFFVTSLGLSLLARYQAQPTDIFDRLPASETQEDGGGGGGGILDELGGGTPSAPTPTGEEATAPAEGQEAPAEAPAQNETQVPLGD